MAKKNSLKPNEDNGKDRICPDCSVTMDTGFIFSPSQSRYFSLYEGKILWNETSPDEGQGFWRENHKPKMKIGKGRFSSVLAYFCKHCELLLVDQEFTYFISKNKMEYKPRKTQEWPDINKLRERLRVIKCPECNNRITKENFCPRCGFDLISPREERKSSKN
ncbi:hypothetical protein CEE45_07355 [Candidatus Heimdallarchaeota archaeon B3_Heim]|nr:MAG: hypothetical protein CEE45_07355 [Candidatus Heimdallarchaeota archaeon B3_Heim]